MKRPLVLGAGTAGTMVANHIRHRMPDDWWLTVVDPSPTHLYQPDGDALPYDLLVTILVHGGAKVIADSGLGDAMGFVPTELDTLKSKEHDDIFVLGDATDLPASKAASVAHFQSGGVVDNLLHAIRGEALEETRINQLGKLAFRSLYWHALLPARPVPLSNRISMAGKRVIETPLLPRATRQFKGKPCSKPHTPDPETFAAAPAEAVQRRVAFIPSKGSLDMASPAWSWPTPPA